MFQRVYSSFSVNGNLRFLSQVVINVLEGLSPDTLQSSYRGISFCLVAVYFEKGGDKMY